MGWGWGGTGSSFLAKTLSQPISKNWPCSWFGSVGGLFDIKFSRPLCSMDKLLQSLQGWQLMLILVKQEMLWFDRRCVPADDILCLKWHHFGVFFPFRFTRLSNIGLKMDCLFPHVWTLMWCSLSCALIPPAIVCWSTSCSDCGVCYVPSTRHPPHPHPAQLYPVLLDVCGSAVSRCKWLTTLNYEVCVCNGIYADVLTVHTYRH